MSLVGNSNCRQSVAIILGFTGVTEHAVATTVLENALGERVVADGTGRYWYWDLSAFANQDYATQISSIDALSYYGSNEWRMATSADMAILKGLTFEGVH